MHPKLHFDQVDLGDGDQDTALRYGLGAPITIKIAFNGIGIALTHVRNCWAIGEPQAGDIFGANCRLAIINPWRAPTSRQPAVQP
jgi:hypothetical protein